MSRMTYLPMIVAVAALAVGLGGRLWADDKGTQQELDHQTVATWRPAYLTAEIPYDTWTTLSNPRASQGKVFYATNVFCENRTWLQLPPELGGHGWEAIRVDQGHSTSFRTPLPIVTSIIVVSDEGSPGSQRTIVFSGYYSDRRPFIESMPAD